MKNRFIQIYTGNGKGKTSAALGISLRAAGAGLKSLIIQFMKTGFEYSERNAVKNLSDKIQIKSFGSDQHVLEKRNPTDDEKREVLKGIDFVWEEYKNQKYDIIILDEICVAVHFGLIEEKKGTALLEEKPENIELILTGRYCPERWIELADLVTEMNEVKHYYTRGILSRKGFDS